MLRLGGAYGSRHWALRYEDHCTRTLFNVVIDGVDKLRGRIAEAMTANSPGIGKRVTPSCYYLLLFLV